MPEPYECADALDVTEFGNTNAASPVNPDVPPNSNDQRTRRPPVSYEYLPTNVPFPISMSVPTAPLSRLVKVISGDMNPTHAEPLYRQYVCVSVVHAIIPVSRLPPVIAASLAAVDANRMTVWRIASSTFLERPALP